MSNEESKETQVVKKKKKWVIPVVIGIVAALILAIVGGIIIVQTLSANSPQKNLKKQMELGDKYLAELDYENAILAYEEALKIDPKEEDAYLALGRIYDALANKCMEEGDLEGAMEYWKSESDVLERGYLVTGSEDIKDKRDESKEKRAEEEKKQAEKQNMPSEPDSQAEPEPEEVRLIIEPGVYDYRIVDEVIGGNTNDAKTWVEKYFGNNYKEEKYGDVHFVRIRLSKDYKVNDDGYVFPYDRVTVSINDNGIAYSVGFEKMGYYQNLYDNTCAYYESKFGKADDEYVGNRDEVSEGMWVCDFHEWKGKNNGKEVFVLQCFSNYPDDDYVTLEYIDESLRDKYD